VVATLVILIVSIQRNTETTRAMMFADLSSNDIELMALADSELNEIYTAWLQSRTSELSEEQKRRVFRISVIVATRQDTAFTMRNSGLLGPNEWEIRSRYLCTSYERAISAGTKDVFLGLMSLELQEYIAATCEP
jgi:hypothetical protein